MDVREDTRPHGDRDNGWMDAWMHGCVAGWRDDEWMHGWMGNSGESGGLNDELCRIFTKKEKKDRNDI